MLVIHKMQTIIGTRGSARRDVASSHSLQGYKENEYFTRISALQKICKLPHIYISEEKVFLEIFY